GRNDQNGAANANGVKQFFLFPLFFSLQDSNLLPHHWETQNKVLKKTITMVQSMVIISDNCITVKLLCGTITQNAPCPAGLRSKRIKPARQGAFGFC
ncbi:MAG: hypothetical protein IKO00_13050, partial [Oscillospiraceae bacterium]|nr:hypothetical protein [Oscillospiraceae bacterium]